MAGCTFDLRFALPSSAQLTSPRDETPRCPSAVALGEGPAVAVPADDQARPRGDAGPRPRVRSGRDAPPAVGPLVVPSVRLRAGLRLAQQRSDDGHLRSAERGGQGL